MMNKNIVASVLLVASLLLSAAFGEDKEDSSQKASPAELPNVLIIGDSISIGYTKRVKELLKDIANVSRPQGNCADSGTGLKNLQTWLGTQKWDVIHFNFGIWDTHWMKGGQIVSIQNIDNDTRRRFTTEEHLENMSKIVAILKKTGAILIWGSTTPYVSYGEDTKLLLQKNNDTDKELMLKEGVTVNDLYNLALPNLKEWQSNDGCHFKPEGYDQLAQQVASTIADVLTKQARETVPNTKNGQ
ncbi:MAG: SGNH/GDSL hydrolase family protein [Lentisphaerae bacterium]|nr:SGNH/GDSL hydrolase family protein [Lentisphaerota bacterium]